MSKICLVTRLLVFTAVVTMITTISNSQPVHAATLTVTNTNDSGAGSLRQALIDANNNLGNDTISFNISGPEPHIISITKPFDTLDNSQLGTNFDNTNTVTVDGCTQPGSVCNQFPLTLKVQVDASAITTTPSSASNAIFNAAGVGSTVKGLSITGGKAKNYNAFGQYRVTFSGSFVHTGGYVLKSNFIGLNLDGTANGNLAALPSGANSIKTFPMQIGGLTPGEGNVIGDNTNGFTFGQASVFSGGTQTNNIVIEGNYFGLDPTGILPRPNGGAAITVATAYKDPITGIPGATIRSNKIANSGTYGINLYKSSGVVVENNEITNSATAGIFVNNVPVVNAGATPPIVKTPTLIQNNIVTGGGRGVVVGASATEAMDTVTIRQNRIYSSSNIGIDLGNDGITANSAAGVTRTGANILLNYPVVRHVSRGPTRVTGTYIGAANQTVTLDFYTTATGDPTGHGEGDQWLGAGNVTTNGTGIGPYSFSFGTTIPTNWIISATATDANGNTSEFSMNTTVGPTIQDHTGSTVAETPTTVNVLSDAAAGDGAITPSSLRLINPVNGNEATSVTISGQGMYVVNPDSTITFTPVVGFTGTSNIQYVVYDAKDAASNNATVTVTVALRALVANNDTFAIPYLGGVAGNVLTNDTLEGSTVIPAEVTPSVLDDAGSGATIDADGKLTIPANTAEGVYPAQYQICEVDYSSNCSQATATVTVLSPFAVDTDDDSIVDGVEDAAPNGGDANNDGTLDKEESNVASFVSSVTGNYVALALSNACDISAVSIKTETQNTTQDTSHDYPVGMMEFTADCGTPGFVAAVAQYYFGTPENNYVIRKYSPANEIYTTLGDSVLQTAIIGAQNATKATYTVVDGSERDLDGIANGVIVDPAGLAVPASIISSGSEPAQGAAGGLADTGQNLILFSGIAMGAMLLGVLIYRIKMSQLPTSLP